MTVARNAATSYGVRVARGVSLLLLTPFLYRQLGAGGFGTWSVMFVITTVLSLLEIGFSAGARKYVAEFHASGQRRELETTIHAAVVLMAVLGAVSAALCAAVGVFGSGIAGDGLEGAFRTGMLVLAAAALLRLPWVAYGSALLGYQRWDLWNLAELVNIVGFALGAVVALTAGAGLVGLSVAYGCAAVLSAVLMPLMLRRVDPTVRLRPARVTLATARHVGAFGSFALLADSMVFIGQRMDTVVIAAIRNAAQAAPFAAASRLVGGLQSLTLPFITLLMPMVSDLAARGRHDAVVRRLRLATHATLQLTLPVALGVALFSGDIMRAWLGGSAAVEGATILTLLMVVQISTLTAYPSEQVLVGLGRVRLVAILAALEGFANLGISIALVASYGAVGAAIGSLVSSAVLAPVKIPLACRAAGCGFLDTVRASIVPPVLATLPGAAAMVVVALTLGPGVQRMLLGMALGLGLSAALVVRRLGPASILARIRSRTARSAAAQEADELDNEPAVSGAP